MPYPPRMSLPVKSGRQQLRALADPLRIEMMNVLAGEPLSAAQLGRRLNVSQALASYHLRKLVEADLVEFVEERANRGARERLFRAKSPSSSIAVTEPDPNASMLMSAVLSEVTRRLAVFEPTRRALVSDAEVWASADVIDAAQDAIETAMATLVSASRPAHSAGTELVSASALVFLLRRDVATDGT